MTAPARAIHPTATGQWTQANQILTTLENNTLNNTVNQPVSAIQGEEYDHRSAEEETAICLSEKENSLLVTTHSLSICMTAPALAI